MSQGPKNLSVFQLMCSVTKVTLLAYQLIITVGNCSKVVP